MPGITNQSPSLWTPRSTAKSQYFEPARTRAVIRLHRIGLPLGCCAGLNRLATLSPDKRKSEPAPSSGEAGCYSATYATLDGLGASGSAVGSSRCLRGLQACAKAGVSHAGNCRVLCSRGADRTPARSCSLAPGSSSICAFAPDYFLATCAKNVDPQKRAFSNLLDLQGKWDRVRGDCAAIVSCRIDAEGKCSQRRSRGDRRCMVVITVTCRAASQR